MCLVASTDGSAATYNRTLNINRLEQSTEQNTNKCFMYWLTQKITLLALSFCSWFHKSEIDGNFLNSWRLSATAFIAPQANWWNLESHFLLKIRDKLRISTILIWLWHCLAGSSQYHRLEQEKKKVQVLERTAIISADGIRHMYIINPLSPKKQILDKTWSEGLRNGHL